MQLFIYLFVYYQSFCFYLSLLTPVLLWLLLEIRLPVKAGMSTDVCAIRALIVDFKTIALWY